MIIQHNLPAMNSHRNLGINNAATSKNLEKLSSGYRINRAGDDAAGLAISEKMRGQIRGLAMATTNASNGVSLIQTAEGGLNETHAILQRMRELAVQSANGTYDDETDRANIAKEAQALKSEIDRISSATNYNGIKLLDGSMGGKTLTDATATAANLLTMNGVGAGTFTVASQIDIDTTNATFKADDKATLIIQAGSASTTGATTPQLALVVGDKTYLQELDATGKTTGNFVDGDGKTVAKFTTPATDITAGNAGGVVSNITFGTAFAATEGLTVSATKSQLIFQIGANGTADQRVGLHVDNMSTGNLGNKVNTTSNPSGTIAGISVATRDLANDAIKVIDAATNQVSGTRADLGALQNRLEHTVNNLGVTRENLQAAESSIRDVDMAKEMMEFTKNNILVQASQAMLAQANQLPQGVLQLLR